MFQIYRTAKLTTMGNIAASGQHTFRERKTPNADPTRTHLNHGQGARSACHRHAPRIDHADRAAWRAAVERL